LVSALAAKVDRLKARKEKVVHESVNLGSRHHAMSIVHEVIFLSLSSSSAFPQALGSDLAGLQDLARTIHDLPYAEATPSECSSFDKAALPIA